jgi:undecaprenyl-diphosphatase
VVAFFRADVAKLVAAAPGALTGRDGEYERLGRLIIAGTIPIVIVGGLFADVIEARLRSPLVVAVTLTIGGIGLIIAERLGRKTREARSLGYGEAVAIGVAQAAALAPGISRSGATLTVSLLLNVERASAARFVFLMSLPAIVAAAAKETLDLSEVGMAGLPVTLLAVGLVVSAIVGYITVKFFVHYLASHSLEVFAYYRFVLAAVTVLWLATR